MRLGHNSAFKLPFSFVQGWSPRTPMLQLYYSGGRVQKLQRPLTSIAHEDRTLAERPCTFTNRTLELKIGTQLGPRSSSPPIAGDLQTRERRDRSRRSETPSQPANWRRQPRRSRGRTTWLHRVAELRRQVEQASELEVEERPPCWPWIAAEDLATT